MSHLILYRNVRNECTDMTMRDKAFNCDVPLIEKHDSNGCNSSVKAYLKGSTTPHADLMGTFVCGSRFIRLESDLYETHLLD
jgi:hypothetical protein